MKVKEAEEMIRVRISTVMRQKRITPSILARKTGISESVIRGYIQEGVVPTAKVSRLMDFKEGLGKNEQNQSKSWI